MGIVSTRQKQFSGVPRLIDKDMIRDSLSKMKNGKAAAPSGVVPEMAKAVGET